MWFKYPIIVLLFLVATLLQTSFLPYFSVMGNILNLVFILFFILIFFTCLQKTKKSHTDDNGIFISIIAGFILDALSPFYFGVSIVALLIIYFGIKTVFYFLKERQ